MPFYLIYLLSFSPLLSIKNNSTILTKRRVCTQSKQTELDLTGIADVEGG